MPIKLNDAIEEICMSETHRFNAPQSKMAERVLHTFPPVFDGNSKVLIVGSIPSVKSRQEGFYYGNPQNRFYRVLAAVLGVDVPQTIGQKKAMLLKHGIAVYDVLSECDIEGSSDLSIKNARVNDFSAIFAAAEIRRVFANGKAAHQYFERFVGAAECLPSTSPANAAWNLERLIGAWTVIRNYIG